MIHEIDAERIKEFYSYISKTFAHNHLKGGNKRWQATVGEAKEYGVESEALVNTILIQEDITRGQRVEEFTVEALCNGTWQHLAKGTTIGYKRLLRFSDCKAERLRITIRASRGEANIKSVGLYYAEPLDEVYIPRWINDIEPEKWCGIGTDASAAYDFDPTTAWRSEGLTALTVDMGCEEEICGFCYTPQMGGELEGTIFKYRFWVSLDGENWTECTTNGEFSNIMHNPIPYFVYFGRSHKARYIKLEPLAEINGEATTTIGEIGVLTH